MSGLEASYPLPMGDVVNLNKFRKAKERAERAAVAEQNRRKHGRTKSDKARENAEREKLEREHAGKHIVSIESDD